MSRTRRHRPFRAFRTACEAPFARFALAVVSRLPRPAVLRLARFLGSAAYLFSARDRRIALANLALAFPDRTPADRRRIARRSLQNFALVVLDLLWFARDTEARMSRWCVETPDFAPRAAPKVPRIAVIGHHGNWEILANYTPRHVAPLMVVSMPLKNPAVEALLHRTRENTGGQILIPRQGALRRLLRHLREGHTCALLLDQNTLPAEGGVFVPFFGLPVPVATSVAALAVKTGAEILSAGALPLPDGRILCRLGAVVTPAEIAALPPETAVADLTRRITADYEAAIRADPEAWLWSYKRWKYIPPGADPAAYPFYARPAPEPPRPKGAAPC